ncbi:Sulfotransferase family protein [Paracoccus isoporae]|uniref:Sulfotransferase family protein n=1 Tax=Paracoccus isoporae TaxID=591205 RepID=A0A1G6SX55_9RHOB|nr:sulfotransferase [Paracoccus isoporae]SDD21321.1 Sulfotransferase family protein [Paracoccus isoporae]
MDIAIFAVTQRTGSTLVQRLFNANKSTLVWGENGQSLVRFMGVHSQAARFSRAARNYRDDYLQTRDESIDISCMAPAENVVRRAVIASLREYLDTLYAPQPGMKIGFKEVTHPPMVVDYFKEAFPEAKTVFVSRHPVSTWRSVPDSWGQSIDNFANAWARNTRGYAERGKVYWMEDVLRDRQTQDEICDLAEITREDFDRVMKVNVNSTKRKDRKPQSDIDLIMDLCGDLIPAHIAEAVKL